MREENDNSILAANNRAHNWHKNQQLRGPNAINNIKMKNTEKQIQLQ